MKHIPVTSIVLWIYAAIAIVFAACNGSTDPPPTTGSIIESIQAKLNSVERDIRIARRDGILLEVIMFSFGDSLPVFVVREQR